MKSIDRVPSGQRIELVDPPGLCQRRQLAVRKKQANKTDLLLRHPHFVAKSLDASFEAPPLACEARALTTELTARIRA